MFARTIADICTKEGLVKPTIVINNNSDGGGNIVRIETHDTSDPDNTLPVSYTHLRKSGMKKPNRFQDFPPSFSTSMVVSGSGIHQTSR